jgi:hypothetical protein
LAKLGVSNRAFAAMVGARSENTIRKADPSRIVRLSDGSIDAEKSLVAWRSAGDPARIKPRTDEPPLRTAVREPVLRTEADARDAIALIARVLQAEGVEAGGPIDFNAARTADTILKAYQRDLAMAQKRKELVPISGVKLHVEKAFVTARQTIQRLPSRHVPAMAAELGVDPGDLDRVLNRAIAAELEDMSGPTIRP